MMLLKDERKWSEFFEVCAGGELSTSPVLSFQITTLPPVNVSEMTPGQNNDHGISHSQTAHPDIVPLRKTTRLQQASLGGGDLVL